jgi:uncharacterized protein (DUF1015 family)
MLKPFRAIRAERNKAHLVPSRSVDLYSTEQLYDKLRNNPYSFLQVIRPETDILITNQERFERIRSRLNQFIDKGIYQLDESPSYFLYEQKSAGRIYSGFIGLLDVNKAEVHLHEKTLESREKLFAEYLESTGFQAEPILVFGASDAKRTELMEKVKLSVPIFDFFTTNEIGHKLWAVTGDLKITLEENFRKNNAYFLADGHHRFGSTKRVAENLKQSQEAQMILTMFMDEKDIGIDSFERWINISNMDFTLELLHDSFEVNQKKGGFEKVEGDIEMFFQGEWFVLKSKQIINRDLPPEYLFSHILNPIFGIKDAKKDRRINYAHQKTFDQSEEMLAKELEVGFRLPPVSVETLKATALAGGTMPPKSTYIEPKLRSGMMLHIFK